MITPTPYRTDTVSLKNIIPDVDSKLSLNTPSGDFFYDPWVIKDEYKNTPWASALDDLKQPVGEARIIKLNPGNCYYAHSDIDDRFHLNITGEKCFLVDIDNNVLHPLTNDNVWYSMDASPIHSAVNFGNKIRYQLVVRKLLSKNNIKNPILINISVKQPVYDYRYRFDNIFSSWLNEANKQGIISNFKNNETDVSFEVDKNFIPVLESMAGDIFLINYEKHN